MEPLRIVFFGTPEFAVPILNSLSSHSKIVAVVSQPDKPLGKGNHKAPSRVSAYAKAFNLPLFTPSSLNQEEFQQHFMSIQADFAVVVAYGKILPQWLLDVPKYGAINIHASLLPLYRGASPITASLLNGDAETGLSYIKMNSRMDEGDIIYSTKISIDGNDNTATLANKLSLLASKDINMVLQKYYAGELIATPQDHTRATYCKLITKEDGLIRFEEPPKNLDRLIRAYYPWPGVWGWYRNKRVKLLPNAMIQMEGKKATSFDNFKHGYPDFPPLRFN